MRAAYWDVVPVIIQDPVWEQSFPERRRRVDPVRLAGRRGDGARATVARGDVAAMRRGTRSGSRGCCGGSAAPVSIRSCSARRRRSTSTRRSCAGPSGGGFAAAAMKSLALAAVVVLSPNPSHFGQLVTAKVSGGTAPRASRRSSSAASTGSTYVLQCLDPACVPGPAARRIRIGSDHGGDRPAHDRGAGLASAPVVPPPDRVPAPSYRDAARRCCARSCSSPPRCWCAAALLLLSGWSRRLDTGAGRRAHRRCSGRSTSFARRSDATARIAAARSTCSAARWPRTRTARSALDLAWSRPEPEPERVLELVEPSRGAHERDPARRLRAPRPRAPPDERDRARRSRRVLVGLVIAAAIAAARPSGEDAQLPARTARPGSSCSICRRASRRTRFSGSARRSPSSPRRTAATAWSSSRTSPTKRCRRARPRPSSSRTRATSRCRQRRTASCRSSRTIRGRTRSAAAPASPRASAWRSGSSRTSTIKRPAVVLVSDLDDDPGDLKSLAGVSLAYRQAGIPVRIVALNPQPQDEALFGRLLERAATVQTGASAGRARADGRRTRPAVARGARGARGARARRYELWAARLTWSPA